MTSILTKPLKSTARSLIFVAMDTIRNPWKTLTDTKVYESPWIRINHHEVINPAGKPGTYSLVHFKNLAIGILPLDEELNTWIVGQYRYPMKQYSWEIPEGGGDRNIAPIDSAKRELLEETGITAQNWQVIQEMHLSNSATDEHAIIYLARDLSFQEAQPDEEEDLRMRKLPFSELYEMVCRGEVLDSLTVAAVLKVQLMLTAGEL